MAATPQDIKDFFALSGNNPAVTNGQLTSVGDWLSSVTGIETPDSNDLVDYIYGTLRQQVLSHKRRETSVTF